MRVHFLHAEQFAGGLSAIFAMSRTITFEKLVTLEFDNHFDPPLFASSLVLGREHMPTSRKTNRRFFPIYADVVVILTSPCKSSMVAQKIAHALMTPRFRPKSCLIVTLGAQKPPVVNGEATLHNPDAESLIGAITSAYRRF